MLNAGALMLYSDTLFSERRLIDLPTSIIIWFTNTCFIKMEEVKETFDIICSLSNAMSPYNKLDKKGQAFFSLLILKSWEMI